MAKQLKTIKPKTLGMEKPEAKHYPKLYLSSKDLPEIKNWEVGHTYKLIVQVKQKSLREEEDETTAEFEIRKIATNPNYKHQQLREKIRDM